MTQASEGQRQKLLDAAAKVFCERGFRSTTVADILEGSGVGRGSFYRQFTNIDEIFLAVKQEGVNRVFRHIAHAVASTPDVADRLKIGLLAFIEAFGALGDYAAVLYAERPTVAGAHRRLRATAADLFTDLIRYNAEKAYEAGLLRSRPDSLTIFMLFSALEAVGIRHVEENGVAPMTDEQVDTLLLFCGRALDGIPEDERSA